MSIINLVSKQIELISIASGWFFTFTRLPESVRKDKKRSGMQIYIREPDTRNLIFAPIFNPTCAAQAFSVEKAVRSHLLGDFSSQNSANPEKMQFAGSVTVYLVGVYIQVSSSGLLTPEDVAISVMLQARIWQLSPAHICEHIQKNGGLLPECFDDGNHYLYPLVHGLRIQDAVPPNS